MADSSASSEAVAISLKADTSGEILVHTCSPPRSDHSQSDALSGASGDTEGPDTRSCCSSGSSSSSETEGPDSCADQEDLYETGDPGQQPTVVVPSDGTDFVASRSVSESTGIKELSVPNMTAFVALDLQEKVQQAGKRRRVVQQSPTDLPPIDPKSLNDLEDSARDLCQNVDKMLDDLKKTLHTMSAISVGCMQVYRGCVEKTCNEIDSNVKTMYAYMAKVEEVSSSFKPVVDLADQLNDIKLVLEKFERQVGIASPL